MLLVLLGEASTVEQKVHLDVGILTFAIATLIPFLTALVTKANAPSAVKAVVTLTLATIASSIQLALDANGVVNLRSWLSNLAITWILAVVTYQGFTKHIGTPAASNVAPNNGIGKPKAA